MQWQRTIIKPPTLTILLTPTKRYPRWIFTDDGVLWQLVGNGADGDNWGLNNMTSTIASQITGPRAISLANDLRRAAVLRVEYKEIHRAF